MPATNRLNLIALIKLGLFDRDKMLLSIVYTAITACRYC